MLKTLNLVIFNLLLLATLFSQNATSSKQFIQNFEKGYIDVLDNIDKYEGKNIESISKLSIRRTCGTVSSPQKVQLTSLKSYSGRLSPQLSQFKEELYNCIYSSSNYLDFTKNLESLRKKANLYKSDNSNCIFVLDVLEGCMEKLVKELRYYNQYNTDFIGWWDDWGQCAAGIVGGAGLGALEGGGIGAAAGGLGAGPGAVIGGIFGGIAGAAAAC